MGMSRHLRFIPDGGALVEVTCRTVQGRLLLCPSSQLNDIILGVLGRAQRKHPVEIVGYVFASNHFHCLLRVENAKQLSDFMCFFNSNLAKEIGRRTGWKEEVRIARLKYVLSHGVKEGLVGRVEEWPGVHCAVPLMTGATVEGTWFDRTLEYNARLRREDFEARKYAFPQEVILSQLPCWRHLDPESYRSRIAQLVQEINSTARRDREAKGIKPLGPKTILAQNPFDRPEAPKKSPAPLFHAFRREARKALWEAYSWFVAAFREAAEKLRAGDCAAKFPIGSFPPHLPFISGALT